MRLNLMGTGEIRARLGISREDVHQLVNRSDFPHFYADLAQGRLWLVEDVDAWIAGWKLGRCDSAPLKARPNMRRLMGAHEIRVHLGGISRQRLYGLTLRNDFPEPVAMIMAGKVWLAEDIEVWHLCRGLQASSPA